MEILDVVDENNNLTGKTEDREIIREKGLWHREVVIWIINQKGEILLQKRASTKKQAPNKWGVTAGHIDAGELPIEVAKREAFEEIGLNIDESDLEFLFITKIEKKFNNEQYNNHFQYSYLSKTNKKISEFIIQKDELSEVKYITLEELEEIIKNKDNNYTFSKRDYMKRVLEYLYKRRNEILN